MILQSEVDQLNTHKRLKVLLIILTTLAALVVLYVVISTGREKVSSPTPAQNVMTNDTKKNDEVTGAPTPEELINRLDELSKASEGTTPVATPSPEELTQRLDELSKTPSGDQPQALSPEELAKKLEELKK